ncbi:MAG: hypothetical protein ABR569_00135 [Gaiellaceae bacterium]
MALPVRLAVVHGLAQEISAAARDARPLAVGGVLAEVLQKELARGGDPTAVLVGGPEGAALYLHVLGTEAVPDEEAFKQARRARVPFVAITHGEERLPYVLATDVVRIRPGAGFPVEEIVRVVARKLGERGTALAARLPLLRGPLCDRLIGTFSLRNGIVGAAVFIPGVDLPVLALNQLRLVLRIAAAHGQEVDAQRLPEVMGTIGAGFGLRNVARELLDFVPVAGWAVKGAVAYAGTRALGEAALLWFAERNRARPG